MKPKVILSTLFVIVFLAAASVFMTVHITADSSNSWQDAAINFDPSHWSHNARNIALFGRWNTDEWRPCLQSPVYTIFQAISFSLFGVGFLQMRIFSVLFTVTSLWLIYLISSRSLGRIWGIICLCISTVCYPFIVVGRSALLEPYLIFFMLLSTWCLSKSYEYGDKKNTRAASLWLFFAALGVVCTFLSKPLAIYYVVSFLFVVLARTPCREAHSRKIASVFVLLPIVVYFIVTYSITSSDFRGDWIRGAMRYSIFHLWIRQPFVWVCRKWLMPVILPAILGFYTSHHLFLRKRIESRYIPVLLMSLTMLLGSQFFAITRRGLRYYVPIAAAAFIVTISLIKAFYRWMVNPREITLSGWIKPLFWWATVSFALKFGVIDVMIWKKYVPHTLTPWLRMAVAAGTALVLLLVVKFRHRYLTRAFLKLGAVGRKVIFFVIIIPLLSHYLLLNWDYLRPWIKRPRYTQYNFSRFMGEHFRDVVIAGNTPLFAVMENGHRAVKVTGYKLNWEWMDKAKITHVLLPERFGKIGQFRKSFPKIMKGAYLLDRFDIAGIGHALYAVDLKPLEFAVTDKLQNDSISITITNPDVHTPQWISLIVIDHVDKNALWIGISTTLCDPLSSKSQEIQLPKVAGHDIEVYAVEAGAWEKAVNRQAINRRIVDDITARGLQAIVFNPPGKKRKADFVGRLIYGGDAAAGDIAVAVSLKGSLDDNDKVRLTWIEDDEIQEETQVLPESISNESYSTYVLAAKSKENLTGRMELTFEGGGTLFVSDVLVINIEEDNLQQQSVWRERIKLAK